MRGPNRRIVVLEKSRMSREVGALISLQPNASKIVDKWAIGSFLASADPIIDRAFRVLDTNGKTQMHIDLDTAMFGANRICYHRQDLHAALREAAASSSLAGAPAEILTASEVVDCDCTAGIVTLTDGTTYEGDLIIGADGIHSAIRKAVAPGAAEPKPTGLSAYRLLIETAKIDSLEIPKEVFDPRAPLTTMMMGHSRRVIMGPGRGGKVLGIVGVVPDEHMNESSLSNSWTTEGSLESMLDTFSDFPFWLRNIFKQAPDLALWQLRDIDSLNTWASGRAIIIGDASHAMLPTQGQGASQSIEDAEALQAFFADVTSQPSAAQVSERLSRIFEARHARASLIQAYSRQQARPATDGQSLKVTLNPAEFMQYNCNYNGAVDWWQKQGGTARAKVA